MIFSFHSFLILILNKKRNDFSNFLYKMSTSVALPPIPRNVTIPLEICSLILNPVTGVDTELSFLELPDQVLINFKKKKKKNSKVYGKALHGKTKVTFKNGNIYEGDFENGMIHGNFIFCRKILAEQ